ncbi:nitroreductase family deazaflavin-dependent oxidoreductase [Streptomyces collinus]|uniref:nitroreductase family deazaflavin-dependent oxidoreductase n=1 Tax=Streptomyces collinus TaxID=42684 RepID=UPI00362847AF
MSGGSGADTGRSPLPTGWRRFLFRLPIQLYRTGLGRLLGQRFLLLEHIGRTTGQPRRVVLEVVTRDDPCGPSWTVASGFGPDAAWYRNLRAAPHVTVQVGARRHAVVARFLPPEDGAEVMARYAVRHPRLAKQLCAFMGLEVREASVQEFRRVGRAIPFVRLEVTGQDPPRNGKAGRRPS